MTILGWFLLVWGVATMVVGVFRPDPIWNLGKIQGFVGLLGDAGTTILLVVVGLAATVGGAWILV
jgi:hypothetical protein